MPAVVKNSRFSVIRPSKVYTPGGTDATLVQHSYPDAKEVLKVIDDFGFFEDKRDLVRKWLGSAHAGETYSIHRGYVAIVLICNE